MTRDAASQKDAAFPEFLDDYFAECEEHFTNIRRLLLLLEASVGRAGVNRQVLDDLFRHFHSLKGISGMVELRQAEDLAHRLEDYLRVLRGGGGAVLIAEGVDALFDGTQVLEQVVAVRRSGGTFPPQTTSSRGLHGWYTRTHRGPHAGYARGRRHPVRRPAAVALQLRAERRAHGSRYARRYRSRTARRRR